MVLAYADPPYPGKARKYYGRDPSYGGEVDHPALVASLEASKYDGWALSTDEDGVREVLHLCPPEARLCPWVKPIGASTRTGGIHSAAEYLIVVRGRQDPPGRRNWLCAQPARGGGTLMGRKPIAFCAWMFDLLGLRPGDTFVDVFPGSGVVGRAAASLGAVVAGSASPKPRGPGPVPSDRDLLLLA